jgi:hypothetical protein
LENAGLELLSVRDLAAPAARSDEAGDGKLTVTLWLARDPRILIAGRLETETT